jgi:hypothetical protein
MKIGYITTPYFGLRTTTHPIYKNDETEGLNNIKSKE